MNEEKHSGTTKKTLMSLIAFGLIFGVISPFFSPMSGFVAGLFAAGATWEGMSGR